MAQNKKKNGSPHGTLIAVSLLALVSLFIILVKKGVIAFDGTPQGNNAPAASAAPQAALSAEDAIRAALDAKSDHVTGEGNLALGNSIAERIYELSSWHVTKDKKNSCTVEVTAPDMQVVIDGAYLSVSRHMMGRDLSDPANYDEAVSKFIRTINTTLWNVDVRTVTTTVVLEKQDGVPQLSYEFADALYGGLLSAAESYQQQYLEGGNG
ncbi:MAG: hypothetical protein IJB22_07770 [Clostridia bacterium]|nr:hypothetical protein [Clostridia bacterium]